MTAAIFSTLKDPSVEPYKTIQNNAVSSWTRLEPRPEIILLGDEQHENGTNDMAKHYGCACAPVLRNGWGTPLVWSLFTEAQKRTDCNVLCFSNGDIVLMQDFLESLEIVSGALEEFVMVASGWSMDQPPDMRGMGEAQLRRLIKDRGCQLQPPTGMDFWAFSRGVYQGDDFIEFFGDIAVGRYKWDNCLTHFALHNRGVPVVDATGDVTAIRQRDNIKFPRADPEAQVNQGWGKKCVAGRMVSATWRLEGGRLCRK